MDITVRDLDATPDDGRRYELVDGTMLVSGTPGTAHQTAVRELLKRLDAACPQDMEVVPGPFAVRPSGTIELRPDVVVSMCVDFTDANLPRAPLVAVEVLEPSSVLIDLLLKKAVYERMGAPSYWIADPRRPSLTVFELDGNGYRLVADVLGNKPFEAMQPFPVRIVPADLLGGLAPECG